MRDDTPTYVAEEAYAFATAPEWAREDPPEPDELDYGQPSDDRTPLEVLAERIRRYQ